MNTYRAGCPAFFLKKNPGQKRSTGLIIRWQEMLACQNFRLKGTIIVITELLHGTSEGA